MSLKSSPATNTTTTSALSTTPPSKCDSSSLGAYISESQRFLLDYPQVISSCPFAYILLGVVGEFLFEYQQVVTHCPCHMRTYESSLLLFTMQANKDHVPFMNIQLYIYLSINKVDVDKSGHAIMQVDDMFVSCSNISFSKKFIK